jgi:hypothetical protein
MDYIQESYRELELHLILALHKVSVCSNSALRKQSQFILSLICDELYINGEVCENFFSNTHGSCVCVCVCVCVSVCAACAHVCACVKVNMKWHYFIIDLQCSGYPFQRETPRNSINIMIHCG